MSDINLDQLRLEVDRVSRLYNAQIKDLQARADKALAAILRNSGLIEQSRLLALIRDGWQVDAKAGIITISRKTDGRIPAFQRVDDNLFYEFMSLSGFYYIIPNVEIEDGGYEYKVNPNIEENVNK